MRDRLGRVLTLLQATPLSPDLVDDPRRIGQWLITVQNLHQALRTLIDPERSPARGAPMRQNLPQSGLPQHDSRADRVLRRFLKLIDGLPQACLAGLSPVIKLDLLRPLLAELEDWSAWLSAHPGLDTTPLDRRLGQYRAAAAMMAARHTAPDPRPPVTERAPAVPAPLRSPLAVPHPRH